MKQEIYFLAVEPDLYTHMILRCNKYGDIVRGEKDKSGLYNVTLRADEIAILQSSDMEDRISIWFKLDKDEDVVKCKKKDFWTITIF